MSVSLAKNSDVAPVQNWIVTYFDKAGNAVQVIEAARREATAKMAAVENVRDIDFTKGVTAVPSAL